MAHDKIRIPIKFLYPLCRTNGHQPETSEAAKQTMVLQEKSLTIQSKNIPLLPSRRRTTRERNTVAFSCCKSTWGVFWEVKMASLLPITCQGLIRKHLFLNYALALHVSTKDTFDASDNSNYLVYLIELRTTLLFIKMAFIILHFRNNSKTRYCRQATEGGIEASHIRLPNYYKYK